MNLDDYPEVRKGLYIAQWIVNLVLGIGAIVLTAQGQSPQWFIITGAVFNFVWTYTGTIASKNVAAVPMAALDGDPAAPPAGFDDVPPADGGVA